MAFGMDEFVDDSCFILLLAVTDMDLCNAAVTGVQFLCVGAGRLSALCDIDGIHHTIIEVIPDIPDPPLFFMGEVIVININELVTVFHPPRPVPSLV